MDFYDIKICINDSAHNISSPFLLTKSVEDIRKLIKDVKLHYCCSEWVQKHHFDECEEVMTTSLIQSCISRCLAEPNTVHEEWFRDFLKCPPSNKDNTVSSSSGLTLTALDFVLQPFENEVMYIPRRKLYFVDYVMEAVGDSLVWRYAFGASTGVGFKALFQEFDNTSANGGIEKRFVEERCVQEVVVAGAGAELTGGTGSYQASVPGVIRLMFDNSCSLFRGNYVEYCVQCVPERTMQAAEKASIDLAAACEHTSALYEALLQSTSADSIDVHVDRRAPGAEGGVAELLARQSQSQREPAEEAPPKGWMEASSKRALNTIYGIPFAGKLVNATVTMGLSGFSTLAGGSAAAPVPPSSSPAASAQNAGGGGVSGSRCDGGREDERVLEELQRGLRACPSDLCAVCGSGSVQDLLRLARRVDVLREEAALERERRAAAEASLQKELAGRGDTIYMLTQENASLKLDCSKMAVLHSDALHAVEEQRLENREVESKNVALYEKLCSLQKEAGVWGVARGRVEEELCHLSGLREREAAERRASLQQCASLREERRELLQHIADLEQQLLACTSNSSGSSSGSGSGAPPPECELEASSAGRGRGADEEEEEVRGLREEVRGLRAERGVAERRLSALQAQLRDATTSSRSELSECKMLQYHYQ
jgi:hypothetical protein